MAQIVVTLNMDDNKITRENFIQLKNEFFDYTVQFVNQHFEIIKTWDLSSDINIVSPQELHEFKFENPHRFKPVRPAIQEIKAEFLGTWKLVEDGYFAVVMSKDTMIDPKLYKPVEIYTGFILNYNANLNPNIHVWDKLGNSFSYSKYNLLSRISERA